MQYLSETGQLRRFVQAATTRVEEAETRLKVVCSRLKKVRLYRGAAPRAVNAMPPLIVTSPRLHVQVEDEQSKREADGLQAQAAERAAHAAVATGLRSQACSRMHALLTSLLYNVRGESYMRVTWRQCLACQRMAACAGGGALGNAGRQ